MPKSLKVAERLSLLNNPQIREAKAQVQVSNIDVKVAHAVFAPRVDLSFESNHSENIGGIKGSNVSQQVNLNMTYNIFNGGADLASTRASRQQFVNSKEVLANTERTVLEDVRTAWSSYQIVKQRLPHLNIHLSAMRHTAENYREQFKLGQRTLLDELNAETEVFNANNNVIDAKFQLITNAYSILFSTGQLV